MLTRTLVTSIWIYDLRILSQIHVDFSLMGYKAVNVDSAIAVGRPCGGTIYLARKVKAKHVTLFEDIGDCDKTVTGNYNTFLD